MDTDNTITSENTPEEAAAEDAAFLASFADTRGEEPPSGNPAAEEVEETPAVEGEPAETPTPAAEPQKLFAGLTEEQLQAALARSGSLQTTVDKMAGRIGQLMQQIESLRTNPPTTQQAQKALDLKLERLSSAFPELANMLREDLSALQGGAQATELAPTTPAGITQEQFDSALNEKLGATRAQLQEQMEVKVLTIIHPDWNQIIRTPDFALWRDNVLTPEAGRQLMSSEDSSFISQHLTKFKEWRAAKSAPAPAPAPAPAARTTRLANAVLPAGRATPAREPATEEELFEAAFKNERRRSGY